MDLPEDVLNLYSKDSGIRLNKYLSICGICSRRQADELIKEGRVYVNGKKASLGTRISAEDIVCADGKIARPKEKFVLIAFNKPVGIECTTDASNPDNIVDFIGYKSRIFPVGRLDKNSSGLILLTNAGEISDKILRGSNYHEKEYSVRISRPVTADFINKMSSGVAILDTVTRPCTVRRTGKYTFDIILTQGLNRQIRRMCAALGCEVKELKRTRIMNISLGDLECGKYRDVEDAELSVLLKMLYGK